MIKKFVPLLSVLALLFAQGCLKRLPAVAGGDKKVVAGHEMTFGSVEEVPDGASIVWTMGDGSRYTGAQVRHAWQRPGKFQVVVTVTDTDGQKRKDSSTVEVSRPALLDVIPATAGFVLLVKTPGENLKNVPLLMEHMFTSGAEVNSTLAKIREILGFDPFSSNGWRDAGLDPTGGIAMAGLDGGRNIVFIAALLPGEKARKTLRHVFLKDEQMAEKPADSAPYISVVTQGDSKDAQFAYMNYRGHLWVAFPDEDKGPKPHAPHNGPVQVLSQLRSGGLQQSLADNKDWFAPAYSSRKDEGSVELFMSRDFVSFANEKDASPEERAEDEAFISKLQFVRMDLDLAPEAINTKMFIGFVGKEASRLASVMRARNTVPAFRTTMADGNHMSLKWSLDLPGLIAAAAEIAGEKDEWEQAISAMNQFKTTTGIDTKKDILDNLGDSVMVAGRLKIGGLMGLTGQGEKKESLSDYLDGTVLVQLRDSKRFFTALDALSHVEGLGSSIRVIKTHGDRQWSIGPKDLGLFLAQADSMAVIATSQDAARASIARLSKPHGPDGRWPEAIDKPDQQVWAMDLLQLRKDFEAFEPSAKNASGVMIKNMLMMTLAGVGKLDMLVATATFRDNVLVVSGSLGMK